MKKILTMSFIVLAGLSLTACGSNSSQDKENSSLKAENSSLKVKSLQQENSSLKAKNDSLRDNENNKQSATTSSSSISTQEDYANLSNEEVATRFKVAKGTTTPDYHASVSNNGDGIYSVDLGKDTPDGQRVEHIGQYIYNAKTGTITTKFESGLN